LGRAVERLTKTRKPDSVCDQLVDVKSGDLPRSDRLRGLGVCVSALINSQGVVRIAPTLGWNRFDLKSALTSRLEPTPRLGCSQTQAQIRQFRRPGLLMIQARE